MSKPVSTVASYLGLIRFSHTIFALPFAAMAMVLAYQKPFPGQSVGPAFRWRELAGVLLCWFCPQPAAMAINRWLDRSFDAENPRTAGRHLPAGMVSTRGVLGLTLGSSIAFIACTALFLPNSIPLLLSIPTLLFLLGYSLAKRFTAAAHLWLGVALALAPICVWLAVRGPSAVSHVADWGIPVTIAAMVTAWVTGFDIIYACQDASFDRNAGLHSVPARFGVAGALRIAAISHSLMIPILASLLWTASDIGLRWIFAGGVLIVTALIVYQHRLVRPNDLSRVGQAFFQTNAIISVVILVATVLDCMV